MAQVVTPPTLERLVRDARILLNQPKPENSRFSDAELTGYANDAVQQIFMWVNEYGEGQFDRSTTDVGHPNYPGLNTTNAIETVALPTDCFAVRGVWWNDGIQARRLEYRGNTLADFDTNNLNNGGVNYEPYYYFRGTNLVLRPIPGFTSTNGPLIVEYTAYPSVLVYGGDTMASGISPLFKELIVMYIVCKAKLKDDLSNGGNTRAPADAHFADLFKNFRHQISERSKGPQYVSIYEPI